MTGSKLRFVYCQTCDESSNRVIGSVCDTRIHTHTHPMRASREWERERDRERRRSKPNIIFVQNARPQMHTNTHKHLLHLDAYAYEREWAILAQQWSDSIGHNRMCGFSIFCTESESALPAAYVRAYVFVFILVKILATVDKYIFYCLISLLLNDNMNGRRCDWDAGNRKAHMVYPILLPVQIYIFTNDYVPTSSANTWSFKKKRRKKNEN